MRLQWLMLLLFLVPNVTLARVFDFKMESVAPTLNIHGGYSSIGKDLYYWQTPATFTGSEVEYIYGGDIGVVFRGQGMGFQLGVLVQTMSALEGVKAFNGASQELYSLDSTAMVFGPHGGFIFQFGRSKGSLWQLTIGGGYQFAKIENDYTLTAQGNADLGLTDFQESFKQDAVFTYISVGYEYVLSGTTTMTLDLGYHYVLSDTWTFGEGGDSLAGSHNQGDGVKLEGGNDKEIDFSYPYFRLGFRFYIDTIK